MLGRFNAGGNVARRGVEVSQFGQGGKFFRYNVPNIALRLSARDLANSSGEVEVAGVYLSIHGLAKPSGNGVRASINGRHLSRPCYVEQREKPYASQPRPNSQTSEFVIWGTKDEAKSDKYVTNSVFEVAPPPAIKRIHPTQKPVELYRELFKILPDAPKVIDLFMGSGVAGVATLDANGDYIGVDNSPEFCRYASTRLNDETKKLF